MFHTGLFSNKYFTVFLLRTRTYSYITSLIFKIQEVNIAKIYSIYSPQSNLPIVPILSLIDIFPPKSRILSVQSPWNSTIPYPCLFWHWCFWRAQIHCIIECSSFWVCFLMIQVMLFWKDYYMSDVSSEEHIRRQMISICAITCEINFDHLAKGVAARFFHSTDRIFPLKKNCNNNKKKIRVSCWVLSIFLCNFPPSSLKVLSDAIELEGRIVRRQLQVNSKYFPLILHL